MNNDNIKIEWISREPKPIGKGKISVKKNKSLSFNEIKKMILEKNSNHPILSPLPFNSGYFMAFEMKTGSAEELRKYLLKEEGIGTISIKDRYLRIAYAAVDFRDLEPLFKAIFKAANELFEIR